MGKVDSEIKDLAKKILEKEESIDDSFIDMIQNLDHLKQINRNILLKLENADESFDAGN